ncbi:glycosyltransferase family 2 protein [Patescibacteria group bacterium]|nr:glycosyltransferase family 2 protein [Patescibacteria group bacterium]
MLTTLSVFFPAFNEEANLRTTVVNAQEVLGRLGLEYEIILVNDGSTDQTGKIADQLDAEDPHIRAIHHQHNRGYGGAFKTGLYAAQYEWIAFTDTDGQFDFSEITHFMEKAKQADLIIGYRKKRADTIIRRINASLFNWEMRLLFGLKTRDVDCGFKLIRKQVVDTITPLDSEGAMVEAELLIKAKRAGFNYLEIPVTHLPRSEGKQTGANLKVIWRGAVVEPIKLLFRLRSL